MSKYGNCGCPDKLAAFMKIVDVAKRSNDAVGVQFVVEYDPYTREKFKLSKEDLDDLKYDRTDIYLKGERLVEWWDIDSAAIIYDI
jgi:hypothetical protein